MKIFTKEMCKYFWRSILYKACQNFHEKTWRSKNKKKENQFIANIFSLTAGPDF